MRWSGISRAESGGGELPDSEGHAVELPQEGGLEEVQALHDLLLVEGAESARAAGRGPSVEAGVRELRVLEKVLERAARQGHARGGTRRGGGLGRVPARGGRRGWRCRRRRGGVEPSGGVGTDEPSTLEKKGRARSGEVSPRMEYLEAALLAGEEAEARCREPA